MDLINPFYKLHNLNKNIFTIRKDEYQDLENKIRQILVPAEELGFEIVDFGIRDHRFSMEGELDRTLKKNIVIKFKKLTAEINLSMSIPKLIDGNYFYINGKRKIPLFQLFDIPVVTRGKTIKIRTNCATLTVIEFKEEPFIRVSFLNKIVPLSLLLLSYYGLDYLDQKFGLKDMEYESTNTLIEKLVYDLKGYYDTSEDYSQDDFIKELGKFSSKYDPTQKGQDMIYALDIILKCDIMSSKFFRTQSILEELIDVIQSEKIDDTNYINKRIRCFEYIVLAKVSKTIFDFCMSNRTAKSPKFNINSTQILSDCNVSDIVQFDFSINPIDELTKLSRTSLVGPGGFDRENVPKHLRDITPSMFGRVCPVDTPDRENCGVLQNLIPNTILDSNLKFTDEYLELQPISIPVSLVPFLEHDDQTRLQMASSQMRQSICLTDFDIPMIQSGCEGLYTDQTQFVRRAKQNGEVIFLDSNHMIVVYDDKTVDIFDTFYRKIYVENLDLIDSIYFKVGDKFKAGDILIESSFCKNGKINIGKNLLTAVTSYDGYNFEDGILISDRLINGKDVFTSIHFIDLSFTLSPSKVLFNLPYRTKDELEEERRTKKKIYKPLPNPKATKSKSPLNFEVLKAGTPYAILKEIPSGPMDFSSIFEEAIPLTIKKQVVGVNEVNIYANEWNKEIPEFNDWVEKKIQSQIEYEKELQKPIYDSLPKDEALQFIRDHDLDKFSHTGKYKSKNEKINGMYVEMYGVYTRSIAVGDKIGNRHGNKGVISRIVPHDKMPRLEDGRHVDICINALGVPSRMNIGQIFELHLGLALENLKKQLIQMIDSDKSQDDIKSYLITFISMIDNTKGKWYSSQFIERVPLIVTKEFIEELTIIQPPFESCTKEMLKIAMEFTGSKYEQKVYLPEFDCFTENMIACGWMYFFRMLHIAESKMTARGIGLYMKKTLQPIGGGNTKRKGILNKGLKPPGGQRAGEMELACLIAQDATENLREILTTKSDCIDKKNQWIKQMIDSDHKETKVIDGCPETVKLLHNYLTVIGIQK
jgi:hypothetical protein